VIPGTFKIAVSSVTGRDEPWLTGAGGGEWDPRWAPQGEKILFVRERGRASALTIALRGGRSTELAGGFIDLAADWSPDGRQVAVSGVLLRGDRHYYLWVIDARTRRMRKLADDVLPPRPSWSPDGRRIAFAAENGLAVVRVRDGKTTTLKQSSSHRDQ
jgi:Tol biopolymer transport system component